MEKPNTEPHLRTMKAIGDRYNRRRREILQGIQDKKCSASMSGIEYYPKPWEDLDVTIEYDRAIISTNLTWDGNKHDLTGLGLKK